MLKLRCDWIECELCAVLTLLHWPVTLWTLGSPHTAAYVGARASTTLTVKAISRYLNILNTTLPTQEGELYISYIITLPFTHWTIFTKLLVATHARIDWMKRDILSLAARWLATLVRLHWTRLLISWLATGHWDHSRGWYTGNTSHTAGNIVPGCVWWGYTIWLTIYNNFTVSGRNIIIYGLSGGGQHRIMLNIDLSSIEAINDTKIIMHNHAGLL